MTHRHVGKRSHTTSLETTRPADAGTSEEHTLQATASYVRHAYQFKTDNDTRKFTQRDPEDGKTVTIYYSADYNTIAVFDHSLGVMRSFYDLNPSIHGMPDNRTWLVNNGARV